MDTNTFKIERGVPIPPRRHGPQRGTAPPRHGYTDVLDRLRPGESVVLPRPISGCHGLTKRLAPKQFTHREIDGGTRVWRIA